jgi:hypothetical protein
MQNVVATSISGTNVQLVVSFETNDDHSQVMCIERPFSSLESLHAALVRRGNAGARLSFPCYPTVPKDSALALLCSELNAYFAHPKVYESAEFKQLMHEDLAPGTGQMTAIDFLLQPFEYEKVHVQRGSKFELQLQVKSKDQVLVWKFDVEDYDIEFSVEFHVPSPMYTEIVHAATRYQATTKPVEGNIRVVIK